MDPIPLTANIVELRQDIQYEHGYSDSDEPEDLEYPVIPTHSHLTMAWVESGILGGICWIYLLALTLRGVLGLASLRPNLMPLYCYLLVGFVWDILYSPFGSVNRLWAAFFILLSYHILQANAQKHPQVLTGTELSINPAGERCGSRGQYRFPALCNPNMLAGAKSRNLIALLFLLVMIAVSGVVAAVPFSTPMGGFWRDAQQFATTGHISSVFTPCGYPALLGLGFRAGGKIRHRHHTATALCTRS